MLVVQSGVWAASHITVPLVYQSTVDSSLAKSPIPVVRQCLWHPQWDTPIALARRILGTVNQDMVGWVWDPCQWEPP
jgi:hypothetical protein